MRKNRAIVTILYVISILFVIGFGLSLWKDYILHYPYGSAPFYLYAIKRAIELLVPAVSCFTTGIIIKKKDVSGCES